MEEGLGVGVTLVTTETHNCTHVIHPYYHTTEQIVKYTSICIAPLGIPGNILAFLVWIRPGMRRSFGVYLASLAITQTMLLACRIIYDLQYGWLVSVTDYPVVCEVYVTFYYMCQYIEPLLYLALTVERYISVYHPFQRRRLCTTKRAIYVSLLIICLSLATASMQAYVFTYDDTLGCHPRREVSESFWNIWSFVTESVFFLLVPVTVFVLNIFVIRGVNKSRNRSSYRGNIPSTSRPRDKVSANSKLLLYVSFYFIINVLPVSIVYSLWKMFPEGDLCVVEENDETWISHYMYFLARTVVEAVTLLHCAVNFYIYMFIGKTFRKEFCKMMTCRYSRIKAY